MTITLDNLTVIQRELIKEVKRGQRVSVELSQKLFENPLEQTIQNNIIYLSRTKDSNVSIDRLVGVYAGRVTKYHHQISQPYIFIKSQENKRVYGVPLVFVKRYKRLK